VKRSGYIRRHTRLAPGGKPRPRKRSASEFARIYGSKARVAWVKSLPCVVGNGSCAGPTENAHTTTGGMGRKAEAGTIVPLCRWHHACLHGRGVGWFRHVHAIDLPTAADATERAWRAYQERSEEQS
jgi:hypothetical protein